MENSSKAQGYRYGASCFLIIAIYGAVSPYLQILLRGLGYGPAAVGVLLGLFEIAGILGPFGLARLADRTGSYKKPLVGAHLLVAASLAPLVLLRNPIFTAFSLAALAVGLKALIPLIDGAIVSYTESGGRSNYGTIRAAGSVGFICMSLALQAIPNFSSSGPGAIALWIGGSALLSCAAVVFLHPDARKKDRTEGRTPGPAGYRRIGPAFVLGLLVIGLGRIAMSPIYSFLSLYAVEELKWDAVGLLWAISAISEIPVMVFSGKIIAKFGAMGSIALSTAAIALRLGICAAFPSPSGLVAAQLLHSIVYGLFQPAAVSFVALKVPPERRALGMAAFVGLGISLPSFIGSSLGGFIVEAWGYRTMFASYIVFVAAALAIYFVFRTKLRKST